MDNMFKYTVAGHSFGIQLPDGFGAEDYLKPYEPFVADSDVDTLFNLRVELVDGLRSTDPGKVLECLNDESPYFWIFEAGDGRFNFGFSYSRSHPDCILKTSDSFRQSVVYVVRDRAERMTEFALSNAVMLLYTFCTAPYDTLMVHASVVSRDGQGYMFLGRSGTGKSTHSRLWLDNIEGTSLLNDDNPVVRAFADKVVIYGTPWSGKTPCYKNESVSLKAVVRLSQAPYNKISGLAPLQAFASLMPACSCMRWDGTSVSALHKTVEKVIVRVPGYHLECLPDADAARVCFEEVSD